MIPGLENAEFLRYGVMHRNTFVDAPRLLDADARAARATAASASPVSSPAPRATSRLRRPGCSPRSTPGPTSTGAPAARAARDDRVRLADRVRDRSRRPRRTSRCTSTSASCRRSPTRVRGKRERYAAYSARAQRRPAPRWLAEYPDARVDAGRATMAEPLPGSRARRPLPRRTSRVERGASPNTVRAYSADLARYLEWAERAGVDPITLTHRQMRRYLAELDRAGYARRTVARRLSAVRSFFAYLVAEGLAAVRPRHRCSAAPKIPSRLPKIVPADALSALLESPDAEHARRACATAPILELLYATGARVSEIAELRPRRARSRAGSDHGDGEGLQGAHRPAAPQGRRHGADATSHDGRPQLVKRGQRRPRVPLGAGTSAVG